jgi:(E)-4-hydroxy-3-methylbut-2-enyl-diphosphate synthase
MTNTDTADIRSTVAQIEQLADAGSELVRMTVNTPKAAESVPEIVERVRAGGRMVPIAGDFHYNGHRLLAEFPSCARSLDKYRINPGNVGNGSRGDQNFAAICRIAADNGKAVRIGVNSGSLDQELVTRKMEENMLLTVPRPSDEIINECMVTSALESVELAEQSGLGRDRIVLSCKSSSPRQLIDVYRELARRTEQPLHLGLTEAGMGTRGVVWSAVSIGILLEEGIGDTIRVSLTPQPGGDRRAEVYAACEILQALGMRVFAPSVVSCPGCGRTTSTVFQALAKDTQDFVRTRMPEWRKQYVGVETLTLAVMGCIVNGPGESRQANVGISLPGTGEKPTCPVFIDGRQVATLKGSPEQLGEAFLQVVESYVANRFPKRM